MEYPEDGRNPQLSSFQRRATIPIITFAALSAIATSSLLTYLAITDFKEWRLTRLSRKRASYVRRVNRTRFKNQGYFWLVNLFVADFIQSIGWVLSSYNLAHNRLWPGFACDVQGFLINVGDVGSSIWSLAIAVHTVLLLAGGQRTRAWAAEKSTTGYGRWALCIGLWLMDIIIGLIGPLVIQKFFYTSKVNGAGGGWCWIGKNYPYERIFFHYFFVFVDMFCLTLLYLFVFCYIRVQLRKFNLALTSTEPTTSTHGQELERWHADLESTGPIGLTPPHQIMTTRMVSVTTEDRGVSHISSNNNNNGIPTNARPTPANQSQLLARKRMLQVASTLLWYPLVYLCTTSLLTVSRLATFADDSWASSILFPGAALYACGGWFNVLLYTTTRKGIVSWSFFGKSKKKSGASRRTSASAQGSRLPPDHEHPYGEKYDSRNSTASSSSNHFNQPKVSPENHIPLNVRYPPASSTRDSSSDIQFEGVDFTHATGFDVVNTSDDSKLVHDRYCVQSRLDSRRPLVGTTVCTCQNIPKYEMNSYNFK